MSGAGGWRVIRERGRRGRVVCPRGIQVMQGCMTVWGLLRVRLSPLTKTLLLTVMLSWRCSSWARPTRHHWWASPGPILTPVTMYSLLLNSRNFISWVRAKWFSSKSQRIGCRLQAVIDFWMEDRLWMYLAWPTPGLVAFHSFVQLTLISQINLEKSQWKEQPLKPNRVCSRVMMLRGKVKGTSPILVLHKAILKLSSVSFTLLNKTLT